MSLLDMQFAVHDFLCSTEFVRYRRPHRRPRIAKKWRRFGKIIKPCPGIMYQVMGRDFIACPCAFAKLKEATP